MSDEDVKFMEQFFSGQGGDKPLDDEEILRIALESVEVGAQRYKGCSLGKLRRVLIIPPDFTRMHSYAGRITAMLTAVLKKNDPPCEVDVMPALGTHAAVSHLIYGSSDGKFNITYCTDNLTRAEIEGVGYRYMPVNEALRKYSPSHLAG